MTIFDQIIQRKIPANIIYEDEKCLAFSDINPVAPVHFLLIPKDRPELTHFSKANDSHKDILGHLIVTSAKIAKDSMISHMGYRLVINEGEFGCQTIDHLHIHVMGGMQLKWPPGVPVAPKGYGVEG